MAKKLICTIGTRPEAIKITPVYFALQARPQDSEPILEVFNLTPDIDLDLMQPGQAQNPYGNGQAARRIVEALLEELCR